MTFNIFHEVAKSYLNSELAILDSVEKKSRSSVIKILCAKLKTYLELEYDKITDRTDLEDFRGKLDIISFSLGILSNTSDQTSSWVIPLIQECYSKCNLNFKEREVLIVVGDDFGSYKVYVNFIESVFSRYHINVNSTKPIDIFQIPNESRFDIASISLIAHEVGHVYFNFAAKKFEGLISTLILLFLQKEGKKIDLFTPSEFEEYFKIIPQHIQEYFCDEIGRYLLGPSFDFALLKFFCSSAADKFSRQRTHPPMIKRIEKSITNLNSIKTKELEFMTSLGSIIKNYFSNDKDNPYNSLFINNTKTDDLLVKIAIDVAGDIFKETNFTFNFTDQYLQKIWNCIVPELNSFRPPFESVTSGVPEKISPSDALLVSTIYFYSGYYAKHHDYFLMSELQDLEKSNIIRDKIIEHLHYSISLSAFLTNSSKIIDIEQLSTSLWDLRNRGEGLQPFVVVPTIDPANQYSSNAVDLRLGPTFITSKLTEFTHIPTDPNDELTKKIDINYFYEKHYIPVSETFTLHPHNFVLASTLEYVSIPLDFYALVLGRSTWGRLGLNIATATAVGPGFRGCITLELRNLSETPINLKVGTRICQICLIRIPIEKASKGYFLSSNKYICPVQAEVPKISFDPDWKLFKKDE